MFENGQQVRLVRDVVYTSEMHGYVLSKDSTGEILETRGDMLLVSFADSTEWVDIDDVEAFE